MLICSSSCNSRIRIPGVLYFWLLKLDNLKRLLKDYWKIGGVCEPCSSALPTLLLALAFSCSCTVDLFPQVSFYYCSYLYSRSSVDTELEWHNLMPYELCYLCSFCASHNHWILSHNITILWFYLPWMVFWGNLGSNAWVNIYRILTSYRISSTMSPAQAVFVPCSWWCLMCTIGFYFWEHGRI